MSIFDKILGKSAKGGPTSGGEEKAEKPKEKTSEKKSMRESSVSATKTELPKKAEEKSVSKKSKVAKPKKEIKARKTPKRENNIAHKILFENIISEKSTMLASQNKYIFRVEKKAGKFQIKEAVEGYYGVQVIDVNTIKIPRKKRIHGRTVGWKKEFKKAVVTLREGDAIAAVEGI